MLWSWEKSKSAQQTHPFRCPFDAWLHLDTVLDDVPAAHVISLLISRTKETTEAANDAVENPNLTGRVALQSACNLGHLAQVPRTRYLLPEIMST